VDEPKRPVARNSSSHNDIGRLFRLDGGVAIVTGGAGRLGSQYVGALLSAGASVAACDLAPVASPAVQQEIDQGASVTFHTVDLTNRGAVDAVVADVCRRHGTPTILVNNAGFGSSPADTAVDTGPFEQYSERAWRAMLDSHLMTMLVASQAFIAAFRRARASRGDLTGSIVNVSSTYGVVSPDQSLYDFRRTPGEEYFKPVGYSVAKSGVLNFTRWLAEYGAPFGVRVNTLVPGGVQESAHAAAFVAEYVKRTPLGRMAREDEYNGAVVFLASNASAYMTGATLVVDGGWTAR
jgi:NAD(P)-dependent dehydrogenase (short-subunit alcohol dehydrogenase family)